MSSRSSGPIAQPDQPTVLDVPLVEGADAQSLAQGHKVGPYRIDRLLGEGGMGAVYLADQIEPIRRPVALKLIRGQLRGGLAEAHFLVERQALALMDHPGIAKVYDAGTTAAGHLFFAMEWIDGPSLSSYCNENDLGLRERLWLFRRVCLGAQHAHQKGVIHRDLKPGNILVTHVDGMAVPKIIDFGIATSVGGADADGDGGGVGETVGTRGYMSPEQTEGNAGQVDIRTDIFALGVILLELLASREAMARIATEGLDNDGVHDALRVSLGQPPRLRAPTDPHIAGTLAAIPEPLRWLLVRAMAPDREDRYDSAQGVADDIDAFLHDYPVSAAPATRRYRLRCFAIRNKVSVAAGALIALALLAGIVGFAWQAQVARSQARIARAQEELARRRANELQQLSEFQTAMLEQINPTTIGKSLSDDVLARYRAELAKSTLPGPVRALQQAAFEAQWQRVDAADVAIGLIDRTFLKPAVAASSARFRQQPLVDAALRQALGDSYSAAGRYAQALPLMRSALAIREAALGDAHRDTLASMMNLGGLYYAMDKPEEAERYFRQSLALQRRLLGADDPATLDSEAALGLALQRQGRFDAAEPLVREALDKRRRILGGNAKATIDSISNLGALLLGRGQPDRAAPLLREALDGYRRVLGENDPRTVTTINNLGVAFLMDGRPREAEPYVRQALEKTRRLQGEDHPDTIPLLVNLGGVLLDERQWSQADATLADAIERGRRVLGNDDARTLIATGRRGMALVQLMRYDEAESLLAPELADARRVLRDAVPKHFALFMLSLGMARSARHEFAPAASALLEAQASFEKTTSKRERTYSTMCLQALVDLNTAWDSAEPGKGHDAQAARWKQALAAQQAPAG